MIRMCIIVHTICSNEGGHESLKGSPIDSAYFLFISGCELLVAMQTRLKLILSHRTQDRSFPQNDELWKLQNQVIKGSLNACI